MSTMSTANEVASDTVSVVLVLMILTVIGALWVWGMALIGGQVVRSLNHIRHGAPDYKYLKRMEAALFAENLTRALELDNKRRNPGE